VQQGRFLFSWRGGGKKRARCAAWQQEGDVLHALHGYTQHLPAHVMRHLHREGLDRGLILHGRNGSL
jgi:hypothetical protein